MTGTDLGAGGFETVRRCLGTRSGMRGLRAHIDKRTQLDERQLALTPPATSFPYQNWAADFSDDSDLPPLTELLRYPNQVIDLIGDDTDDDDDDEGGEKCSTLSIDSSYCLPPSLYQLAACTSDYRGASVAATSNGEKYLWGNIFVERTQSITRHPWLSSEADHCGRTESVGSVSIVAGHNDLAADLSASFVRERPRHEYDICSVETSRTQRTDRIKSVIGGNEAPLLITDCSAQTLNPTSGSATSTAGPSEPDPAINPYFEDHDSKDSR
ncbi:hypothetical protein GJ744_002079 [Endocarpon pusillum]|uniref:Uncharacterized protein n=1 Tax=Endocarpon pusillum TaxID=364733 RepID=A0A8H7AAT2_9EURO|nr:hypothetical protein GJ744_002079 [Endocarpon pusillum]